MHAEKLPASLADRIGINVIAKLYKEPVGSAVVEIHQAALLMAIAADFAVLFPLVTASVETTSSRD